MSMYSTVERFIQQQELHRTEGRRGVENLCKLVQSLDTQYKDRQYFGQLNNGTSIGDLILFLEDNSGAVTAIIEWISEQNNNQWKQLLNEQLPEDEEDEDDN